MSGSEASGAPGEPRADRIGELFGSADRHLREGRFEQAERNYLEALASKPGVPEALNNLGYVYLRLGRFDEAEKHLRASLAVRPEFAAARYNLALALKHGGRLEEAARCLHEALASRPGFPEAHDDLGRIYRLLGKFDEAEACFRQAIAARADFAEAHQNLGALLLQANRPEEAERCLRRALALRPGLPGVYNNLGIALVQLGRYEEAERSYRSALAAVPDDPGAAYNLSRLRLLLGDYESGFELFESRFEGGGTEQFGAYREFLAKFEKLSRWRGEPLQGKGVLVLFEQGLGDNLMMLRYLAMIKRAGAPRLIVVCPPELVSLIETIPEVDRVMAGGAVPLEGIAYYSPIMSLPFLFRTRLATVPRQAPFVRAGELATRHWREQLAAFHGFKVGIVWQGRILQPWERDRAFGLGHFSSLARLPGICLVSLQKNAPREQLDEFRVQFPIADFTAELHTLADTAALIANLDLVIACDTAVAHLAGVVAAPVWVALPLSADWRWLLDRTDSPWYPTMRLFRQESRGDWAGVFAELEQALRERLRNAEGGR